MFSHRQQIEGSFLVRSGRVKINGEGRSHTFFTVGKRSVVFSKITFEWSCTCEYGSLWKGEKKKYCKHVYAARKMYLKTIKGKLYES